MRKSKPRQLHFTFAESPQGDGAEGGADASASKPAPVPTVKCSDQSESTSPRAVDASRLLDAVAAKSNLRLALHKVVGNKGAPGIDGVSVQAVYRERSTILSKLREALLSESYVPGDIRRVWIPKPNGGQRGLGIPTVVDRVVQQAVLQVLEPIYEPTFHDSSHGFRPGRGAQTAIAEAASYVTKGLLFTVDIDLESFFDKVNHQRLLDRLGQRIADKRLLRLVRLMLKARVVLPDGTRVSTEEGTPQGGPLSPLLSNIVLDELDRELARRGLRFVRYADDCNIYVGSLRAGQRVMASVRKFIEGRLRLKVNEKKSAVDRTHRRHFLGFRVGGTKKNKLFVQLSKRTLERLDTKIRALTPRSWGRPLDECMRQLSRYLKGWMGYFRLCTADVLRTLKYFDGHIRRRLRAIMVRQKKRPRFLYRHLIARGVSRGSAARSAFSRRGLWWQSRSGGVQKAYPNHWFGSRVPPLETLWQKSHYDWRPDPGIPF